MTLHPFNLRMLAEDLVRVRRPDDRERYAASQRQARIDPNPHQIDAVTGTLLGDINTFREVFCADDDRTLVPGQEHELQRRLGMVLQRTLRRQAQEFLDRPFTQRRCRLYEYAMSDDERSLYDDVTEYLLQPTLHAFAGSQRRLLLIGFHRRMASSIPALAASLENVAARLRRLDAGHRARVAHDDLYDLEDELEDEDEVEEAAEDQPVPVDREAVAVELARVEDFVARAKSLPHDAKARSFQDAIRVILDLGRDGRGSGKAVVFTESITTQEYVRRLLLDIGLRDEDVTLFRGNNDHDRAKQAHARWIEEEGRNLPPGTRPTREVATRLALVHEFRTRSKVLVCTEAGAKGLNLQFCETVINYDLPWNPQRIEQRIGRCHRYSQQRDVTVVNFIAKDNEAHSLTFEILSQKLDLFGKVLDASDVVLHEPRTDAPEIAVSALSLEFKKDLENIYSRSRTLDEVTREIAALRDKIAGRRDAYEKEYERTSQIIESRFDEDVRRVFRRLREELPQGLVQLDRDIADLVDGYLRSKGIAYERSEQAGRVVFDVAPGAEMPAPIRDERRFATGDARGLADAQPLNLLHPLVKAAIADARAWSGGSVELLPPPNAAPELSALSGKTGVLAVALADYAGFEPVQRLVAGAVFDGDVTLDPSLAAQIARLQAVDAEPFAATVDPRSLDDAVDEALPARDPGDTRLRIGCVHGCTFDIAGYQTNFPICRDAGVQRGLDYLAIGDTHSFRDVTESLPVPTVYPGAPEPTNFDEAGAGSVALVALFRHGSRPRVEPAPVGFWRWIDVKCRDINELRTLLTRQDLERHVVRLRLDMAVSLSEENEVERILRDLQGTDATHGRAGILLVDRTNLRLQPGSDGIFAAASEEQKRLATEVAALESTIAAEAVRIEAAVSGTRLAAEHARTAVESAQEAQKKAIAEHASQLGRLEELRRQRDSQDLAGAENRLREAADRHAAVPVPERLVTDVEVMAARNAEASARADLERIVGEIHKTHGALEQVGGSVARERLRDAIEALDLAERHEREIEAEYDAWLLLLEQMKEADAAQATNLGQMLAPAIAGRFEELTQRRYENVRLTAHLGTEGVVVGGAVRSMERVSVGTREQLSTLYRLSLAEYLKTTVVLDDQLVQSDDTRMDWFRALLVEKARNFQIIVFTCRPVDYVPQGAMVPPGTSTSQDTDAGFVRAIDLSRAIQKR